MFLNATAFNGDISNWKTELVTTMISMFQGAKAFDQDISKWDVKKVTNHTDGMFKDTTLADVKKPKFNP